MATSVLRFIASGGFGEVYKYDSKKGVGVVARKVFNINMEHSAKHERNVLTKIGHHDNIVSYKGYGVVSAGFSPTVMEGAPYIDFEYIDGPSLWDMCYKEDVANDWLTTLPRVCDIFRGLLAAVHHVHEQGLIHLDLKPGNVMVVKARAGSCHRLKPILIDFGISQPANNPEQLQDHRGTDGYQPPEWWAGVLPTQAYDVWGLGVIFYELLYGQRAVPISEALKRMKNRGNGIEDSNHNIALINNGTGDTTNGTNTAERRERLVWQNKFKVAMEKASSEIQLLPRKANRFPFIIPNDVHALVLHMLGKEKERPTIKQVLGSPMFKSIQEGTYEQEQHSKNRALQRAMDLESEKKQIEKQLDKLQEELRRMQQYNTAQAAAPKSATAKKVDISVGTEGEDELRAAVRQRQNLETIIKDNEKVIEEYCTQIETLEDKLSMEIEERSKQKEEFAAKEAKFEEELQRERNASKSTLVKLQQVSEINKNLELKVLEVESRYKAELQKAKEEYEQKILEAKSQHEAEMQKAKEAYKAQEDLFSTGWLSLADELQQPPLQQPPVQQEQLPVPSADLLEQVIDRSGISAFVDTRVVTEAPKRTTTNHAAAGASGTSGTKRMRTVPDLQHLTLGQYQSILDSGISTAKLPDVDAAWKALDWAYGLYQKNAGDINNPPSVLKQVIVDHTKESTGQQVTSPFEEWVVLVLQRLGAGNDTLKKRAIFMKLTGRGSNAYSALIKRYTKK
jgi:serine/threonine protein kinase